MKKRITSVMLALCLLLPMLPVTARATSNYCGDNVTWELADGVLTISGTGNMTDYKSENYVPWAKMLTSIRSVDIRDGVTSIGNYAFSGCGSLTSVTIPGSVTSIGRSAFSGCGSLSEVTIPNSVTSIGGWAFFKCGKLTGVTIPDNVTSIAEHAFSGSGLTSVTIPNNVASIEKYAFNECSSLSSVTMSDSVTSIKEYAFYNCSSLASVRIPCNVKSIGSYVFCGTKVDSIDVDRNSSYYVSEDGVLFTKDMTTLVAYPNGKVGPYSIPNGVTRIEGTAFFGCIGLTSVDIPSSVTKIEHSAFGGCAKLGVVNYDGSKNQWDKIDTSAQGNDPLKKAKKIYKKYDIVVSADPKEGGKVTGGGVYELNADVTITAVANECYKFEEWKWTENSNQVYTVSEDTHHVIVKDNQEFVAVFTESEHRTVVDCSGTPPTCTEPGLKDRLKCSVCGKVTQEQTEISPTGHTWGEETPGITKPATCTEDGVRTYTKHCTVDGCDGVEEIRTEVIDATGHTEVTISGKAATCTEPGLTDGSTCSVCGTVIKAQEVIPATGHSYEEWITTKEPTSAENGTRKRSCTVCRITETETIPATGGGTTEPGEQKMFTITFAANGGTVAPQDAKTGTDGKLSELPTPNWDNHAFQGWYTTADGGTVITTGTVFTEDSTIYARWTKNPPSAQTTYTVTFNANGGTVAPQDAKTGTDGKLSELPTPNWDNHTFQGWYTTADGGTMVTTGTVFTEDSTVYAKWEEDGGTATHYSISISNSAAGGSVHVSHSSAAEGTRITIELSFRSGYELDWLSAVNLDTGRELSLTRRNDDEYTFIMPASSVELEASFRAQYSGNWYVSENTLVRNKPVRWYYKNGQIRHVTDGLVSASTPLTRDMLVSVLYNMDSSSTGEPAFWATTYKIMPDIYPSGLWGTDKSISREQTAMILYCYAQHMGYDLSPNADLTGCDDYEQMRPIARTAMSWAQATGLITDDSSNRLSPKSTLTCGEANTILSRFVSMVA